MRLFVAIPLPAELATAAFTVLPEIPALRRVRPELMHVTLAFLGAVPDERLADVVGAATAAASGRRAFSVAIDTVGRFPSGGAPTVAWLGVGEGANEMTILAESLRRSLAAASLPFDAKPFRPHVTLARVRDRAGRDEVRAIAAAIARARVPAMRFTAEAVSVVESVVSSKGPRYTALAVVPLVVGGTRDPAGP